MRWVILIALMCAGCVSRSLKLPSQDGAVLHDRDRMALATRLTAAGYPVTAARQYVEVVRKHQSPLLEEEALQRLERLIIEQDLPPTLVSVGILGDTGASARTGSDFLAYLEWHRSLRESHGEWAAEAKENMEKSGYWWVRMRLEQTEGLLASGELVEAGQVLRELETNAADYPEEQRLHLQRSHARIAYASGEFTKAIELLDTQTLALETGVDELERAWAYLQLGNTGRALGLGWAARRLSTDPVDSLEAQMLTALAWLDTCNSGLAAREIDALEKMLEEDVSDLQRGVSVSELAWAHRLADADPGRRVLSKFKGRVAEELVRGVAHDVVRETLTSLTGRMETTFQTSEIHRNQEGALALLERFGQVQWMKHQLAFVYPGGPRPNLVAHQGMRTFSGVGVGWDEGILYVQDGELWNDELQSLGALGEDRCE